MEPRPRQRDFLADAKPPDEGLSRRQMKIPGPEQGRIVTAIVQPRSELLAGNAVALARLFVPCQRKVKKGVLGKSVLISRPLDINRSVAARAFLSYSLGRKSCGFGPGAWVRPAVIFEVVDRLLLLTGHPTTELTPARTNISFFNCLQQRNQTFQR